MKIFKMENTEVLHTVYPFAIMSAFKAKVVDEETPQNELCVKMPPM